MPKLKADVDEVVSLSHSLITHVHSLLNVIHKSGSSQSLGATEIYSIKYLHTKNLAY